MCRLFFAWQPGIHPHGTLQLNIQQLYEFVIYTSSQNRNERWQLISKLVQFTDAHFPGGTLNSYDNLNNKKLDLNVSTRSVNFSANNQMEAVALVYKLGWLQVFSKCLALYFLKGTHLGICRNGIFCTWTRLFVFLARYLPTVTLLIISDIARYSRSCQMLDPL